MSGAGKFAGGSFGITAYVARQMVIKQEQIRIYKGQRWLFFKTCGRQRVRITDDIVSNIFALTSAIELN
jgi:hypothetical protein